MPTLNFYMDDSGTRKPDRAPTAFDPSRPNHFALGGILVMEEEAVPVGEGHRASRNGESRCGLGIVAAAWFGGAVG
jgi:hypothetical protein